jgi:hypothetical protein
VTGRDDSCDDHDEDAPQRDLGEVPVDEPVEPAVDMRTAQEREAALDSTASSGDEDCGCPSDKVDAELDELVEPTAEFRTIQEREAADETDREEGEDDA